MRTPLLLSTFLALVAPTHAQTLIRVGRTPADDFLKIQEAVDAAADGDRILVRDGTYAGFTISAKSIDLIAHGDLARVAGSVIVEDLAIDQSVTLQGLEVAPTLPHFGAPFTLRNSAGVIVLERCELLGPEGGSEFTFSMPGLSVTDCGAVVVSSCFVRASNVGTVPVVFPAANPGADLVRSTVVAYDTWFVGGPGEFFGKVGASYYGDPGVWIRDGSLRAMGCRFEGGCGGPGVSGYGFCVEGSQGGPGVRVGGFFDYQPGELLAFACEFIGGPGGFRGVNLTQGTACPPGQTGDLLIVSPSSSSSVTPGVARSFAATNPAVRGQDAELHFEGPRGHLALLALGQNFGLQDFPLDAALGSLVLLPDFDVQFVGVIDGTGALTVTLPALDPQLPGPAQIFRAQGLFVDPVTVELSLGNFTSAWVIDPGL